MVATKGARGVRAIAEEVDLIARARRIVDEANQNLLQNHPNFQHYYYRFRVYEFDSVAGQREAFRSAAVVVGPQGTAFSGVGFAGEGLKAIIEWA